MNRNELNAQLKGHSRFQNRSTRLGFDSGSQESPGHPLTAANTAQKPAFYLQAKWDYDTRATIDLAYAHAYGSNDSTHGNRFVASIFPYKKFLLENGEVDYQSAHAGFAEDTDVWGSSVRAFLKLYGVK